MHVVNGVCFLALVQATRRCSLSPLLQSRRGAVAFPGLSSVSSDYPVSMPPPRDDKFVSISPSTSQANSDDDIAEDEAAAVGFGSCPAGGHRDGSGLIRLPTAISDSPSQGVVMIFQVTPVGVETLIREPTMLLVTLMQSLVPQHRWSMKPQVKLGARTLMLSSNTS